jgi:aminopeptidase N
LAAPQDRSAHFDETSGRSTLNYPPHPFVEYLRTSIDLDIPSMQEPTLSATVTHTIAPIGRDLRALNLHCGPRESTTFTSATLQPIPEPNQPAAAPVVTVAFAHENERLALTFDPPLKPGTRYNLAIAYTLKDPPDGLVWTPASPAWPGRAPQLHTQGQPESNRFWLPSHDFPNTRVVTNLSVNLPAGFTALSNGRLAARTESKDPRGERVTYRWEQARPHANYLVSLVVGQFDVVDLTTSGLSMPVYAPQGKGPLVQGTYGRTPQMVAFFESYLDEPFPWDKYAQSIVWNFGAGGMENTSTTTMFDTAILEPAALQDGDLDGLISHELAHQWFGDLITCRSWEHIWLNEGFATYFTHLWFEKRDGRDAYLWGLLSNRSTLLAADTTPAPFAGGMASKQYAHPWEVFRRAANPYPKGAFTLHMLRARLGDSLFRQALARYVDRFKDQAVETADLRTTLEEASGQSLERFFSQWVTRPMLPIVAVTPQADGDDLLLTFTQKQTINGDNPAFALDVPVLTRVGTGAPLRRTVSFDTTSHQVRLEGAAAALSGTGLLVIDPDATVLAHWQIDRPAEAWARQLLSASTLEPALPALVHAAEALAKAAPEDRETAVTALVATLSDERLFYGLRIRAAESLGALRAGRAGALLSTSPPNDARVRRALVAAAAAECAPDRAPAEPVVDTLTTLAASDPSYAVRAAALTALGDLKARRALPTLLAALDAPSQHDQVRQAAIAALANLGTADATTPIARAAQPGLSTRTRAAAVTALGRLGRATPPATAAALAPFLRDREARVARAAAEAIVALEDPRAVPTLQARRAEVTTRQEREQFDRWIAALQAAPAAPASPAPAAASEAPKAPPAPGTRPGFKAPK